MKVCRRETCLRVLVCLAALMGMPGEGLAQEADGAKKDGAKKKSTYLQFSFDNLLSVAPATENEPSIRVTLPEDQVGTREVTVQRLRTEQRTRVVKVDGKAVEQQYAVQVPFTEKIQQAFTVRAMHDRIVPVTDVRGWDVMGKELEPIELIDRLQKPTIGFLLSKPWPEGAKISDDKLAVLRDDVLFLRVPLKMTPLPLKQRNARRPPRR